MATLAAASAVAVTLTAPAAHAITGGTTAGGWNQPLQEVARITIGALQRGCTGTLIAPTWVVTAASCFATDPAQGFQIQPGPPPMPTVVQVGDEASPDKQTMGGGPDPAADLRPVHQLVQHHHHDHRGNDDDHVVEPHLGV
ncbi:trypsin-like serine protease, partial [Kibdelosporangium lantanae]